MALPMIQPAGPGGPLVDSMKGINALQELMLKNKYYGPSKEAEINNTNALTKGKNIENQYLPEKLKQANVFAGLQNQYYGPNKESEINNRNALTNKYNTMTPLEAKELELKNQFYPEVTKSNIAYKNSGGAGAGVGQKELLGFRQQLANDNPTWDQDTVNQAANAYLSGEVNLPNGEPLPPISGQAKPYMDLIAKRGTTAGLVTGGIKAKQAEAELEVLSKYANEGLKPYGTTYFGKNPDQIMDSFKNDKASQERLGRFIASQALQYEASQNRIRLANGQPGVTATEGLMKASQQIIHSQFPRLSQEARQEATRFMDEALKKGLEARNSIDIGASSLKNKSKITPTKEKPDFKNMTNEELKAYING